MSVTVRLSAIGKKGEKKFRIVVATTKSKNRGKVIEVLGFVDQNMKKTVVDKNRLQNWKENGAKVSVSVDKLLV